MKPNQIRSELILRGITVTSIAKKLGIKQPTVSGVIYGTRPTKRIREAIALAIGKTVQEVFPE